MEGTPQQPSVPAGWYPDPNGEGQRYWDGAAWTEHTAPAAAAASPAAEGTSATATDAAAQGAQQAASQQAPGAANPHAAYAGSAAATGEEPGTMEWTLSALLPIFPIAGLIWGVYLKRQGPAMENPANLAIVLSLVVILIAVLLFR